MTDPTDALRLLREIVEQLNWEIARTVPAPPGGQSVGPRPDQSPAVQRYARGLQPIADKLAAVLPLLEQQQPKPKLLIDTKGDVEAACRCEQKVGDGRDYLEYALHHIKAAIAKRDDAPCSSAEHAKAAQVAIELERCPAYRDVVAVWEREAKAKSEQQVAAQETSR